MTTNAIHVEPVQIGLSTDNRTQLIERLNTLLADEHLVYTKTRNYHWNVTGIHFVTLHEILEQQYDTLKVMADDIAERARMLGGYPIGTMTEFMERTRLAENPGHVPSAQTMLTNLLDDHEHIITTLRNDIEACAEELNDEGTADLLVGVMRSHEEMAWMLRSLLDE